MPQSHNVLAAGSAKALAARADPALLYKYYLEIEGVYVAEFLECNGLEIEREVKIYEEGGTNDFVYALPGRVKFKNIQLKRGITYSADLWNWFREGMYDGRVRYVNMTIVLGNAEGLKVQHWNVFQAYPVRYKGPTLKSDSTEAAVEELELVHRGFELNESETRNPMTHS